MIRWSFSTPLRSHFDGVSEKSKSAERAPAGLPAQVSGTLLRLDQTGARLVLPGISQKFENKGRTIVVVFSTNWHFSSQIVINIWQFPLKYMCAMKMFSYSPLLPNQNQEKTDGIK